MTLRRLLLAGMFYLGSITAATAADLTAHDAWVRAAPPGATVFAAYLTIENRGAHRHTLLHVSSPQFERIEMHRSELRNGVATMSVQTRLTIAAHAPLRFTPSGYHLMLIGPRQAMYPGAGVVLQLHFDGGVRVPVRAVVRADATTDTATPHSSAH